MRESKSVDNLHKLNKHVQNDHLHTMQHKQTSKPLDVTKQQIYKDSIDNFVKHQDIREIKQNQEKLQYLKDIQSYNMNKPNQYKSQLITNKKQSDESRWMFENEYQNKRNYD